MSLSNLKVGADVDTEDRDVVGGNKFTVPSNIYSTAVDMAYMGVSSGGAISATVVANVDGKEVREIFYVTNKQKEPFYIDKTTGKKKIAVGLLAMNNLAQVTLGKDLSDLDTEKRTVKIWDSKQSKEVPTEVDVLVDLLDKPIQIAIQECKEDQTTLNAQTKQYEPNGKVRTLNKMSKFLHPEKGLTDLEMKSDELPETTYAQAWLKQNQGNIYDTSTVAAAGSSNASTEATGSLFNKK